MPEVRPERLRPLVEVGRNDLPATHPSDAAGPRFEPPTGLTEAEAQRRHKAGQGNVIVSQSARTYKQVLRENVFNFVNDVLFTLGFLLVVLGNYLDALITVGVIVLNSLVGLAQEIRAKILLDRIAILTRPKATVIRDGRERELDPSQIVRGDLLVLHAGDQIVVDGRLLSGEHLQVDESLLSGESDLVAKHRGDELFSGSFVVAGGGRYEAERVGANCLVNKITAGALAFRRVLTPLQRQVNFIIRSALLVVLAFEVLIIIKVLVDHISFTQVVRSSTVIFALVPVGLVLAIALAYALGAIRMAGKGALVQQANSVESMSNIDVLCTDKTGTLTTNNIRVHALQPLGIGEDELQRLLGRFAASASEGNRTTAALHDAFGGAAAHPLEEVVFSSARKWSALSVSEDGFRGTFVLGAPEIIAPSLAAGEALPELLDAWASEGLRVLLFAHRPAPEPLYERAHPPASGEPAAEPQARLPANLQPLGLVSLSDELRPRVQDTLREFAAAGIRLKIISGDSPQTVAALARQAGLSEPLAVISGLELAGMSDVDLGQAAEEHNIFGRVSPEQKEKLVDALRKRGHYVAMIGDGVNDVISLKRANVAIAMQGGSQAARAVADMVLLKDSFAALPWAFREGQRVFNGMTDILRIFIVRIFTKALLVVGIAAIGSFAFQPRQTSLLSFFAAGLPAILLAVFAKPGPQPHANYLARLGRFVVPASMLMALIGTALFTAYAVVAHQSFNPKVFGGIPTQIGHDVYAAQTVLTVFLIFCHLLLLPLVVPPTPFWTGGAPLRRDWKPAVLSFLMFFGFMAVALSKLGRTSFDLALLHWQDYVVCAAAAVTWMLGTRYLWRKRLLDKFLGVGDLPPLAEHPSSSA
jgi:cation-transporting ATPase E